MVHQGATHYSRSVLSNQDFGHDDILSPGDSRCHHIHHSGCPFYFTAVNLILHKPVSPLHISFSPMSRLTASSSYVCGNILGVGATPMRDNHVVWEWYAHINPSWPVTSHLSRGSHSCLTYLHYKGLYSSQEYPFCAWRLLPAIFTHHDGDIRACFNPWALGHCSCDRCDHLYLGSHFLSRNTQTWHLPKLLETFFRH